MWIYQKITALTETSRNCLVLSDLQGMLYPWHPRLLVPWKTCPCPFLKNLQLFPAWSTGSLLSLSPEPLGSVEVLALLLRRSQIRINFDETPPVQGRSKSTPPLDWRWRSLVTSCVDTVINSHLGGDVYAGVDVEFYYGNHSSLTKCVLRNK